MNRYFSFAIGAACCLLSAGPAAADTIITMSSDFESPTFSIGAVSPNPNATGQGGWGGYNSVLVGNQLVVASITDEQAHSGTQSMRTTADTRSMLKALDPSLGEYPFAGFFSINGALDWWIQAWVRIDSGGGGITMTGSNSLGGCPLLQIAGNGVPYVNSCLSHDPNQASLGAGAFDQWLALEMVHTVDMGQAMVFSITGPGIDRDITLPNYSGPGSGPLQYLGLSGAAYWDDVRAGTGTAPSPVPLPGAAWLMISAFGAALGPARRRRLR